MARVMRGVCMRAASLYAGHSIKARYYLGAECISLALRSLSSQRRSRSKRKMLSSVGRMMITPVDTHTHAAPDVVTHNFSSCVRADLAFIGCVGEELLLGRLMR